MLSPNVEATSKDVCQEVKDCGSQGFSNRTGTLKWLQSGFRRTKLMFWSDHNKILFPILWRICVEEWVKTPVNYCEKFVEGNPKRSTQVVHIEKIILPTKEMQTSDFDLSENIPAFSK